MGKYKSLAGFYVGRLKNGKILNFLHEVFCLFLHNLSTMGKNNLNKKKIGATDLPSELNKSKVNAADTIPLCGQIVLWRTRSCMT